MTSTPTACPRLCVKFYGDFATYYCRYQSVAVCADVDCSVEHPTDKPRQPDNEMNELLMETIVRGQNKPDTSARLEWTIFCELSNGWWNVVEYPNGFHPKGEKFKVVDARALEEMGALKADRAMYVREFDAAYKVARKHQSENESLREQLAAAELRAGEYEKEIAHALRYLRESGAGDERLRGEPEFEMLESFERVLSKHRREGES